MALDRFDHFPADLYGADVDGAQEFWAALARDTDGGINFVSPGGDRSLVDEGELELGEDWLAPLVDEPPVTAAREVAAHNRRDAAWGREGRGERDLDDRERPAPPVLRRPTRRAARRFPTRLRELPTTRARHVDRRRGVSLQGGAATGGLLAALGVVLLVAFAPVRSSPTREAIAPPSRASALTRALDAGGARGLPVRAVRERASTKRPTRRRFQARTARLAVKAPRTPAAPAASGPAPTDAPATAPSSPCCDSFPLRSQGGGGRDDGGGQRDSGGGRGGNGGQEFGFER